MNDNENNTAAQPEEQQTHDEKKQIAAVKVMIDIAAQVEKSGDEIRARLIKSRVDAEIEKRKTTLDAALTKRAQLHADLRKIDRADQIGHDAKGAVVTESYSKTRLDEIKKAKEALDKLDQAIGKALESNDFNKLKEQKTE